jgi:sulfatase maturation enzyme AslB (radical SAM superfamily)
VRIAPELAWQVVDGEGVIVDLPRRCMLGLSPSAAFIWSRIETETEEEIAAGLARTFDVDEARAQDRRARLPRPAPRARLRGGVLVAPPRPSAVLQQRALRQAQPLSALLELTYACNWRCVFCYNPRHHDRRRLDGDEWRAVIDDLRELGTLNVTLTGGEPLTHPQAFRSHGGGSLARDDVSTLHERVARHG